MKKQLLLLAGALTFGYSNAQQIATFEDLTLGANTYWNGSTQPDGTTFVSGSFLFPNKYNSSFGGYWESGWSYSSMQDSSTSGFGNMYAAKALTGYNASGTYGIGTQNSILKVNGIGGVDFAGLYITNSTYAANSMRDGDSFAKKFGGSTGDDADFFMIVINKYRGGQIVDTVQFYLADYRFTNNIEDYIVKDWRYVDLQSDGTPVDSIEFTLSSSDNGTFGMNTPAYFCVDNVNFVFYSGLAGNNHLNKKATAYPTPAARELNLSFPTTETLSIELIDFTGKMLAHYEAAGNLQLDVANFPKGIYFVRATSNDYNETIKFVKE